MQVFQLCPFHFERSSYAEEELWSINLWRLKNLLSFHRLFWHLIYHLIIKQFKAYDFIEKHTNIIYKH